jgi:ubiquinone/menaquinone biosynthesis C-methylase UbiE
VTSQTETARILREYERRSETIPSGFYSLDQPANYFAHCQLARAIISLLDRRGLLPIKGKKILDIGCGTGNWLLEYLQWGAMPADLHGIDLDSARIAEARLRIQGATLQAGDASSLSFADNSIDLVSQFTVFSSILDDKMKRAVAAEMLRVVRPGGAILSYDLRVCNSANPAVREISLNEIRRLFPGLQLEARRITLAPPIARLIAPHSWITASVLERVSALCSHNLALLWKK